MWSHGRDSPHLTLYTSHQRSVLYTITLLSFCSQWKEVGIFDNVSSELFLDERNHIPKMPIFFQRHRVTCADVCFQINPTQDGLTDTGYFFFFFPGDANLFTSGA